ncbi:MAG: DUF4340 domain-containing protein [Spirochaetia bacterium]
MSSVQRRYILTIAVLAAATLAVLLFTTLRNPNRINYQLPEFAAIEHADIDKIVIDRPNETVTLSRSGSEWFVKPGNHPADRASTLYILDAILGLQITDVVSARDDPAQYNLGDENRVRVTLVGDGKELRVIDIGRRAATLGHTFVGVPGDNRILQAIGELRGIFDRDLDAFRDKSVLSFDPSTIDEITLIKTIPPAVPEQVRVVRTTDGWVRADRSAAGPLNSNEIRNTLNFLGSLSAYRYRYSDDTLSNPWLQVQITGEETYTLSIFAQDGNVYPARTSESGDDFDMFLFQASLITDSFGLERPGDD